MLSSSSLVKGSSRPLTEKSKFNASDSSDRASPSVGNLSIRAYLSSASDFVAAATV